MKQNYINPQTSINIDLGQVKRQIQHRNLQFNQRQLQIRDQILKQKKQSQKQRQYILNQKALKQLQQERRKQIQKKLKLQNVLQNQYDTQISTRQKNQKQQKYHQNIYAELEKLNNQRNQQRRIIDLSKMYKIQSHELPANKQFFNEKIRITTQPDCLDNIKNQDHKPQTSSKTRQHSQIKEKQMNKQTPIKMNKSVIQTQPSGQNLSDSYYRRYPAYKIEHSQYLKREINERKRKRQSEKLEQLKRDKQYIQRHKKSYNDSLIEQLYERQHRKNTYKQGLEKQIQYKQQRQQVQPYFRNRNYQKS